MLLEPVHCQSKVCQRTFPDRLEVEPLPALCVVEPEEVPSLPGNARVKAEDLRGTSVRDAEHRRRPFLQRAWWAAWYGR